MKDGKALERSFRDVLQKNPYLDEKKLKTMLERELCGLLDADFENYCTEDDYCKPVVKDYFENGSVIAEDFCGRRGLVLDDFDFDGDMGDYEPDHYGYDF